LTDPVFDGERLAEADRMQYIPNDVLEVWKSDERANLFDEADQAAYAASYRALTDLIAAMHDAGVPILAGTDTALLGETRWLVPGWSLHDELLLLVDAGLTPLQAIRAATANAAEALRILEDPLCRLS